MIRRKKGVLGPLNIGERIIIFVDDLNMSTIEDFGAQPSIKILCHWQSQESGGWHDRKMLIFYYSDGIQVIIAMRLGG